MKFAIAQFYQAASSNYSRGRTQPVRYITIHHSAGWENTLRYLWADPNRNGSSHFWVGNNQGAIEQYVDTDDTAWTNGNWYSNNESITIEVRGDWRGYYNQATLDNLETLLKSLRKAYPNVLISYHKDVSDKITLCPADLKDKGYARSVWDKVTAWLNPPKPPTPAITYRPITPKRVKLVRNANLWNFNFTDWTKAQIVQNYQAGHVVDVVAVAKNSLGGEYYMTAYSYNGGAVRATNGFNVADCEDYVAQITQQPTVEPKWEPMATARKMRTVYDLYVIDLDTMKPQGAVIPKGTDIDLVEKKTLSNNKMYLRSKWARDNNKNWGVPIDQLEEITAVPREPVAEPPININPDVPTSSDVDKRLTALEKLVKIITDFLDKVFKDWRK